MVPRKPTFTPKLFSSLTQAAKGWVRVQVFEASGFRVQGLTEREGFGVFGLECVRI